MATEGPHRPSPAPGNVSVATTSGEPSATSDIAGRIDRIPIGRFHIRVASILGAGTFFDGFDALSLAVILPLVIATFGLDTAQAGVIISAGYVGQVIGAWIIGALADRIGRRPAFVLSLAVFSILSLACAVAWNDSSLLVFRAIQGIGLGAEVPIAGTLISEYLGRGNRGRFALIYQSMFSWGAFFTPLIGLLLTATMEPELAWRVLLGLGVLPLAIAVWAWFALPESARWLASKNREAEADRIVTRMEQEAVAKGVVLDAVVPVPAPLTSTLRLGELVSDRYRRRTLMLAVAWFATSFISYGISIWMPTMYVKVGGLQPSYSLLLTCILVLFALSATYTAAWLIERVGRRPLLIGGFALTLVGTIFGAVAVGLLGWTSWPVLFGTAVVAIVGTNIPFAMLWGYTAELFPTRMRSWAVSAFGGISRVASIITPLLYGYMLAGHGGAGGVFTAMAGAALVGLVVLAMFAIETRNRSLEEISR